MRLTYFICTFFHVGRLRPAAGTWGSLAALPAAWALHVAGGPWLLFLGFLLATIVGLWAVGVELGERIDDDPSEFVIDEVAGQWLALLPVSIGASHAGADLLNLWPGILFAFLAFRALDILKPGPIGWADRQKNALGVMLDDILAGLATALCVMLAAWLYHGILGL